MKNNKMVKYPLILGLVALVAGLLLAVVYNVTKPVIDRNTMKRENAAIVEMLGSNGSISVSDFMIDYSDGMNVGAVRGEAFYGCSALQTIRLGEEIGALADKVFYQCYSLQEIVIPDSIKSVGKCCFGSPCH